MLYKFEKSVVWAAIHKYEDEELDLYTYESVEKYLMIPTLQSVQLDEKDMRRLGKYL